MTSHRIGTREEWFGARAELLEREKEHTRADDELARQRRKLPWVPVEKQYTLQTEHGPKTLRELFDGRSQLLKLLNQRSVRRRRWSQCRTRAQAGRTSYGYLSEGHGLSTFACEGETVYHCYSTYACGTEFLMGYYAILDRAPMGRDEGGQSMSWLRRHNEYESA